MVGVVQVPLNTQAKGGRERGERKREDAYGE
jgi:hypothetical protein